MTSGIGAFSTLVIWNYHRVLEMLNIGGPSQSRDMIDVTSHDSPNAFREFVAGPASGGEVSIEGNFLKGNADGQIALHADVQGGTKRTAWIVAPMVAGGAWTFEAIAKGFDLTYPHEDKIGVSGSLQVTGKPDFFTPQSAGISALAGIEQTGGSALVITPAPAAGVYAYACTVNTASTWVKLTVTAAAHTIKVQGETQTTGVQGGEIALGAAGTTTEIFIMVYEAAKSPRLYVLTVTRPSP